MTAVARRAVLLVAAWLVLLVPPAPAHAQDYRAMATGWIRDGAVVTHWNETIEKEAASFLQGTRYQGRIQVNLPPRPGYANFFVVKSEVLGSTFKCGCRHVPAIEGVVCDATFLHRFINLLALPPRSDLKGELAGGYNAISPIYAKFLTSWLLGHEMGHLVLGTGTPADTPATLAPLDIDTDLGTKEEAEADIFFLSKLGHRTDVQTATYLGLSQFTTRLYAGYADAQHPEKVAALVAAKKHPYFSTTIDIKVPTSSARHPPWLLRALSLSDQLIDYYPKIVDNSGYFRGVRAHTHPDVTPSGPQPCEAVILPVEHVVPEPPAFDEIGDAELVDRLALIGETDLAERQLQRWEVGAGQGAFASKVSAYVELTRLGMPVATVPRSQRREAVLAAYRRDRAAIDADISLPIAYAVALARNAVKGQDEPALRSALTTIDALVDRGKGVWKTEPRQVAIFRMNRFEIDAAARGLDDPAVRDQVGKLGGLLRDYELYVRARDFLRTWRRVAAERYERGSFDELQNDIAMYDLVEQIGLPIDAMILGVDVAARMKSHHPELLPWQAYWHDRIGRVLMGAARYDEALELFRYSAERRDQILELARTKAPDQVGDAGTQDAIAWNQVGYAELIGQHPDRALVSFERSRVALALAGKPSELDQSILHQNLAQTHLALGNKREALDNAKAALALRIEIKDDPSKILDSLSVLAGAQYLNGMKAAASATLIKWKETASQLGDFDTPIGRYGMVIAGKFVPLTTILGRPLPEPGRMQEVIARSTRPGRLLSSVKQEF